MTEQEQDVGAIIEEALRPGAGPEAAAAAHAAFGALARRASGGDAAAHDRYHELLWALHADRDHRSYALRWWIAGAGYAVDEAAIAPVEIGEALAPDAFAARIREEHASRSGLRHPMSVYFFEGAPTLDEFKIYLRHHWHRSRLFYRELAELALSRELAEASVVFRNLYDEGGQEESAGAHPFLLQRLLRHLEVPCGFDDVPELTEARAYLSNRIRCARHPNPAWGLAVLFALEYGTPATHGNIYRLLRRLGVPEEACEFHRLHMTADIEHAEETVSLIAALIRGAEDQGIFLASLRHHRALGGRYFDAIWREVQGEARA
ncbi:MAG: iron-containing redox enzyme family protein [Myxococcales bacterium]|nr:iron-containing redox enzyme family protein [Myxococcales bacterium]